METFDIGKLLSRIGAILVILAGVVQIGEYGIYVVMDLLNYGYPGPYMVLWLATGVVALIFGVLVLLFFVPMADKNRVNSAILIIVFAILGAALAWEWAMIGAPGAILCLVGGILFFIEAEGEGA